MRDQIDRVIAEGAYDALPPMLEEAKTPEIRYAANRLVDAATSRGGLLRQAKAWIDRGDPAALHLACQLIPSGYEHDAAAAVSMLKELAGSPHWTVRNAAAETCGRLLRRDFERMIEFLHSWRGDPDPAVRRAVAAAAARAARSERLEWAEPLLKLVGPLLDDEDQSIRRTLGPSTLGRALLGAYPTQAFEYLVTWSTSNEPPTLWNVAMAFSAPPAARIVRKALIVLRKLSLDERHVVRRAVASAMWRLGRRCPETVRPELMRWLEDERRVEVARQALRHL